MLPPDPPEGAFWTAEVVVALPPLADMVPFIVKIPEA
jgi:hypothetical protein